MSVGLKTSDLCILESVRRVITNPRIVSERFEHVCFFLQNAIYEFVSSFFQDSTENIVFNFF